MSQNFKDLLIELNILRLDSFDVEFEISRVFSANARWIPNVGYKNGKAYGYLRLADEASELKEEVRDKIKALVPSIKFLKETIAVEVHAEIALPEDKILLKSRKGLKKIDLSNMWQVIENGLVEGLELDDSLTVDLHLRKTLSKDHKYYLKLSFITYGE